MLLNLVLECAQCTVGFKNIQFNLQMFLHRDSASVKFHSRTWREYVDGFSDKSGRCLWMGLENAHRLTLNTMCLHVVMTGPAGYTGSIQYPGFRVYGGDPYEYSFSHQPHQRAKQTGWRINTGQEVIQPSISNQVLYNVVSTLQTCACVRAFEYMSI